MTIQSQNREEAGREYTFAWLTMMLFRSGTASYNEASATVFRLEDQFQFSREELRALRSSARSLFSGI